MHLQQSEMFKCFFLNSVRRICNASFIIQNNSLVCVRCGWAVTLGWPGKTLKSFTNLIWLNSQVNDQRSFELWSLLPLLNNSLLSNVSTERMHRGFSNVNCSQSKQIKSTLRLQPPASLESQSQERVWPQSFVSERTSGCGFHSPWNLP